MDPFSRRRPKASKGSAEESKSKLATIILAHCHSVLGLPLFLQDSIFLTPMAIVAKTFETGHLRPVTGCDD